jgi:hypothetical protein
MVGLTLSLLAVAVVLTILIIEKKRVAAFLLGGALIALYAPLAISKGPRHGTEPVYPYHVQNAQGQAASNRRYHDQFSSWEFDVEENGIYDLVIEDPPIAYILSIDDKYVTHIYNTGVDGPLPEPGVWEVQASLKLSEGFHKFQVIPAPSFWTDHELQLFYVAFREKQLPQTRDMNDELQRKYQAKLVKR